MAKLYGEIGRALAAASRFRPHAELALEGEPLSAGLAHEILAVDDEGLPGVLWAAFAVRYHHFGRRVKLCLLNNARSGLCPEDCGYCSQSSVSSAPIERYRMKTVAQLVAGASAAATAGARRYCMVTSARGPGARDIGHLADAARRIRADHPDLELCVSLGIMGDDAATTLRNAGVAYVNHNLNTSRRLYPEICSTHTWDDRIETVRSAQRAGMRICSGVIVGMGETAADLVDVAAALRSLAVESLPVNFLHPIDGTPLGDRQPPSPGWCLRALALFRLTNPRADIRAAGGRERALGGSQGLALFAASSIFVDGYLTTPGQAPDEAGATIEAAGFEVERDGDAVDASAVGWEQA